MKLFYTAAGTRKMAAAMVALCSLLAGGCGPSKPGNQDQPTAPVSASTNRAALTAKAIPEGDADLLAPAAATTGPMSEADIAWEEVMKLVQPPTVPSEWESNPPTKDVMAKFEKENGEAFAAAAEKAKEFYTRYPAHEKAEEARQAEYSLFGVAAQLGSTNAIARRQGLEETRLRDPSVPENERIQIRVEQIEAASLDRRATNTTAALEEMEKSVRALQKDFPKRPDLAGLLLSVAQRRLANGDMDKARALAREILAGKPEEELQKTTEELIKKLDRVGRPVAIKFKAMDGREVDLQQMKNKVVLIDFWATWCKPCIEALPAVKATYEKFNSKGFEIIGISFDRDREDLEKVTARQKMTWPQCFDEGGAANRFGDEFEIEGIPTMWLVDKKGLLRDLNAHEKLAEKVEKLLAEP